MDLHRLPKVELHRHLEGSIRLPTAFALNALSRAPLPARTPEALRDALQVLEPMESLEQVLKVFEYIATLFSSPAAVRRITAEVVTDAAREGIRLLELRFSPDYMARSAGLDWDALMEALLKGLEDADVGQDMAVGLIAIVSRNLGVASAKDTLAFATRWRTSLVGFDLADDERSWPSHLFEEALRPLEALKLPLTVHSGEAGGPQDMWNTLTHLKPARIGHGVAAIRDPDLVQHLISRRVLIEACPTSNLRTRAVPDLARHPARALLEAGVPVTICTDDPGLFDIDLPGELALAQAELGFSDAQLEALQVHALRASFLPLERKREVAARWFEGWGGAGLLNG